MESFASYLENEFKRTKQVFLTAISNLSAARTIVINVSIKLFSYENGNLRIGLLKGFLLDIVELLSRSGRRKIVIVFSGLDDKILSKYANGAELNAELRDALSIVARNDIFSVCTRELHECGFSAIGIDVPTGSVKDKGLEKTLQKARGILKSSKPADSDKKLDALNGLLTPNTTSSLAQEKKFAANDAAKKIKNLLYSKHLEHLIPIIVGGNDVSKEDDNLAFLIAESMQADVLIYLSSRGMLFTEDPVDHPDTCEPFYCYDTGRTPPFSSPERRKQIERKLNFARKINSGSKTIPMVLLSYTQRGDLTDVFDRKKLRLLCDGATDDFPKFTTFLNSKKFKYPYERYYTYGDVMIDKGAETALTQDKRSLLLKGIMSVSGDFEKGTVIRIINESKQVVGCGVSNFSSMEIAALLGSSSETSTDHPEAILRDKMRLKQQR